MSLNPKLNPLLPLMFLGLLAACGESSDGSDTVGVDDAVSNPVGAPDTAPVAEERPARDVFSERLAYGEVDSELVYGHFAIPADMVEPLPAVVMIHERWGLNATVREQADRLAGQGYIVLAVDLFDGRTSSDQVGSNRLMQDVMESPDNTLQNIEQALGFVRNVAGAPAVAVLGADLGGEWALRSASLLPDFVDAAVTVYGQVTTDAELLAALQAPLLGLYGATDRSVRVDSVREFEAALLELQKEHEIHVYPDSGRYFSNPQVENRYDPVASADAWSRIHEFLARNLDTTAR
ncbi:MAG: dienelactone hydrolase family protein [Pseudomonadota bacterium]